MRSPWERAVVIDLTTVEGCKLFTTSIAPILVPKLEGNQSEFLIFLTHLSNKGLMLGWNDTIFHINTGTVAVPNYNDANGNR